MSVDGPKIIKNAGVGIDDRRTGFCLLYSKICA